MLDLMRCRCPSLPRTATLWPSPAIRTSGCRAHSPQRIAANSTTAPAQRNGVRNKPITMIPRLAAISGAMPKAGMRPTAPGNAATQRDTATIQSMPIPISHQNGPSSPNGAAIKPNRPAGITRAETTGIAPRLASTPNGVTRWKWKAA